MNHVETLHCNVSTIAHEKLQQQIFCSDKINIFQLKFCYQRKADCYEIVIKRNIYLLVLKDPYLSLHVFSI